jgi:hypothetical protein
MTTALTPALALDYVRELSADVIGGVVLDADGNLLAGPEALAGPARDLLASGGSEGRTKAGAVFAAHSDRHAIVVVTGRFALARVTRHDLRTALAALGGQAPPDGPPDAAPRAAVEALLTAAQDGFRPHSAVSSAQYRV